MDCARIPDPGRSLCIPAPARETTGITRAVAGGPSTSPLEPVAGAGEEHRPPTVRPSGKTGFPASASLVSGTYPAIVAGVRGDAGYP